MANDWPPCVAVMTVVFVPSSAAESARAVTISRPETAKKSVLLVVSVPLNFEPSDIVTAAVATRVPAGELSAIVVFAGASEIAVGCGGRGSVTGPDQAPLDQNQKRF